MTNYERLCKQTVEEVARERVLLVREGSIEFFHITFGRIYFGRFGPLNREAAYAEALRLEMEWLMSESGVEK